MSRTRSESLRGWFWPIAVAVTVVFASGRGQVAGPSVVNFDKLVHFSVFGLMATLVCRQLAPSRRIWAIVVIALFGLADELRQGFTPGRSMGFDDWVADTAGAAVATLAYTGWRSYRELLERPLWGRRSSRLIEPSVNKPATAAAVTP